MTINPPPTCTAGSDIPKNARMCVPIRYEPTSRKKLLIAICRESALLYGAILPGQREKNWATAERIHDGEQSADNEDDVADSFHCTLSGEFRMSRRVSHVRIGTRVGEPRNTPSELLVRLRGRMKR